MTDDELRNYLWGFTLQAATIYRIKEAVRDLNAAGAEVLNLRGVGKGVIAINFTYGGGYGIVKVIDSREDVKAFFCVDGDELNILTSEQENLERELANA